MIANPPEKQSHTTTTNASEQFTRMTAEGIWRKLTGFQPRRQETCGTDPRREKWLPLLKSQREAVIKRASKAGKVSSLLLFASPLTTPTFSGF